MEKAGQAEQSILF